MLAKMRTIAEAIEEIREIDPHTAFTQTALRRMLKTGLIPSVRIGCKYLVNLDVLFGYLNNAELPEIATKTGIRALNEKVFI